ncbi:hypothetical protein [Carboxylicivirga marina]|uniref:DUF4935 domain-containing protein n=1 Tax=Carboxylicivirga marina TaxID=2800988 RepID=A0ABS1HQK9_9BACT|nr:hypothetical protein [Carboxylicivirga marina]MBK3519957.1 hypothetical protein [Carboxylicivirga marina]
MTIKFLKDVFEDAHLHDELDYLWKVIISKNHSLVQIDSLTKDAILESTWYRGARKSLQELINHTITRSIQSSTTIPKIHISNTSDDHHYSISEAIGMLEKDFEIIFEHSENDAHLFNALLRNFKKKSKKIRKLKDNGILEYGMGGGSTIESMITSKLDKFNGQNYPKPSHKYIHCFVIFDSDCTYPNQGLKTDKDNLIKFLESKEIPYHVLEKREMENYIPDEVFDEVNYLKDYFNAYLQLSPVQKDYFDIENGFPSDKNFSSIKPPEIQKLYGDLTDEVKKVFRDNNAKKINGSSRQNFKTEFPKLFSSQKVTRESLLKRCSHHDPKNINNPCNPNELPDLLSDIEKYL